MSTVYLYHPLTEIKVPDQYEQYSKDYHEVYDLHDASCTSLIVSGTYFDDEMLEVLIQKVRKNGTLTIDGPDLLDISRGVITGNLTNEEVRKLVHSEEHLYSASEIVEKFKSKGLMIQQIRVNNYSFTVTGKRV